jgi:hypothetical protein
MTATLDMHHDMLLSSLTHERWSIYIGQCATGTGVPVYTLPALQLRVSSYNFIYAYAIISLGVSYM